VLYSFAITERVALPRHSQSTRLSLGQGNEPMADSMMYHDGNRQLQDQFESRRIADRLEEKTTRTVFSADDKALIESAIYFFVATADAQGRPDCSFKGGAPGFVRITGPSELAFPDYDGNGMFKSLGNLLVNPNVGLLFITMHGRPARLRVNGTARVSRDDPLLGETVGAQLIVRVAARAIFPNCPRYAPKLQLIEPSIYAPRAGCEPPEPAWKGFNDFKDAIHPRQPTFKG
jgi:predicted pyridoxine 5'-phosphate oxidase superfamily flavin-nucleotide-binding protein